MGSIILVALLALLIGAGLGFILYKNQQDKKTILEKGRGDGILEQARRESENIRNKAEKDARQLLRESKEQSDKEFRDKQRSFADQEKNLLKKEAVLEQKIEEKDRELARIKLKEEEIGSKTKKLEEEAQKYKNLQAELNEKLSQIARMTQEEARLELRAGLIEQAKVDAAKEIRRIEEEAKEDAEKKAKRLMGIAIQRFAGEYVAEKTISTVELPSDDVKGRLIGREGRNIRAFEQICGVDLIIDDTPEVVVISSFNVVRREIARQTIHRLIADGRIHPAKIEEFYDKSKIEFEAHLRDLGEKAQMEIGVHGIHPEVLKLIGALNYRTSYTQNQYQHALEASFICGAMAAELGLNVKQARRAGLLHDIGKVLDASAEGSHAVIGADFAKKYGESADIVHAIRAHHDDEKPESVLAHLVAASDALSGARPGARKALMESYVSRLTDIEQIVNSFPGVTKTYALSAGREIRVLVENDKVSDEQTIMLSRDIAKKIEDEMSYPGTIKVTVVRETKAVGIAR